MLIFFDGSASVAAGDLSETGVDSVVAAADVVVAAAFTGNISRWATSKHSRSIGARTEGLRWAANAGPGRPIMTEKDFLHFVEIIQTEH